MKSKCGRCQGTGWVAGYGTCNWCGGDGTMTYKKTGSIKNTSKK